MKYFAYGMNTNIEQMVSRCKDAVVISPAWIDGYELTFRTHADIDSNTDARCHGVLWDITMRDLRTLDLVEGFPYYYTRFSVRVNTGKYVVNALVYQMRDQSIRETPPEDYLKIVTNGYQQNGVPTKQLDVAINRICSTSTAINLGLLPTR
jgi:gamma-glutamylcyclotransferase (GGCT)/AIG2-like uncharacterized protein YtfP